MGAFALGANHSGGANVAIGHNSLGNNVNGSFNTVVGADAGSNIVAGRRNAYIGLFVGGPADESNTVRIADNLPTGAGLSACFIGGILSNVVTGANVHIDPVTQRLGIVPSSLRFKKDIKPMDKASEWVLALKPVTFHYKGDETNMPQFGLIAEEVAKVNPALILVDKEGKPYTVRYEQINAMLLNEFLKEHKTVQELKSTVKKQEAIIAQEYKSFQSKLAAQEKQIEILTAGLEKVSAQLADAGPSRDGLKLSESGLQIALSSR